MEQNIVELKQQLKQLVNAAEAALAEAEAFADEHDMSFSFEPAYGMGGWYEDGEWNPSSQSC